MAKDNTVTQCATMRISIDGDTGPYIVVALGQVEAVRQLLDRHQIGYWLDTNAIAVDGKPAVAIINLGKNADIQHVEAVLKKAG